MAAMFEFDHSAPQSDMLLMRLLQILSPDSVAQTPEEAGRNDARKAFEPLKPLIRMTEHDGNKVTVSA